MAERERRVGVELTDREHATVLAALRYYQSVMRMGGGNPPYRVVQIADNDGTLVPLSAEEIDTLCEGINCDYREVP